MKTFLRVTGTISIFLFGFFAINYCIFYVIATLFNITPGLIFYTLFILAVISYPLSTLGGRIFSNRIIRIFYIIASSWMGISFYLLTFIGIYCIFSLFYNIPNEIAGIIIILLTLILSTYSFINSQYSVVKHIKMPLKHLKKDLKVVQISDIHIGAIRNSSYIEKIVKKTNKLDPEISFITGDMVDGSARLDTTTFNAINKLKAPIFFINGNHEIYEGLDEVFRILKKTNMKILRDELYEYNGIQIIGVEYSYKPNHLKKVISQLKINPEIPSILLYHLPRGLKTVANANIGLQLSGHTHAGQIFPFNYLAKLVFRYMHGIYTYNETYLYVSPGTGTWGPPMRFGSRCEITVINLKSEKPDI